MVPKGSNYLFYHWYLQITNGHCLEFNQKRNTWDKIYLIVHSILLLQLSDKTAASPSISGIMQNGINSLNWLDQLTDENLALPTLRHLARARSEPNNRVNEDWWWRGLWLQWPSQSWPVQILCILWGLTQVPTPPWCSLTSHQ